MNCREYVDLMTDYLEGELSQQKKDLWEKHFGDCPDCKRFFESFQSSLDIVEFLQTNTCPVSIKNRLEAIVVETAQKRAADFPVE